MSAAPMQRDCPECGETIKTVAKKCRFCGTFFDPTLKKRQRRRGREGPKPPPDGRETASSALILAGSPGFFVCAFEHVCMAGHMHHGPYPSWHYATEALWVFGFVGAAVVTVGSETCRRWVRPLFLAGIVATRLVLGGALAPIELLIAIILGIAAIVSLARRASS